MDVPSGPEAGRVSRRALLRSGAGAAGALMLPTLLSACGSGGGTATNAAAGGGAGASHSAGSGTINVLAWSFYQVPGLKVGHIASNWTPIGVTSDLYTKTAQPGTFDVADPSNASAPTMIELGRLQPLDETRLPNLSSLVPDFLRNPSFRGADGKLYAVPVAYYFSYTMWDKKQTAGPRTFEDLLAPALKGKIGMYDSELSILALARAAGMTSAAFTHQQLDQLVGMLNRLKPQIRSIYPYGGAINLLARGEIAVAFPAYLSEIDSARKAGADAGWNFFGSYGGIDTFALVKGAKNPDAAYTFMNNALTVPAQVALSKAAFVQPVIKGAEDKVPSQVRQFGTIDELLKHAPSMGGIPPKAENGKVGLAELASAWQSFKGSL